MKRSEMVQTIMNLTESFRGRWPNDPMRRAHALLARMEDLGMSPLGYSKPESCGCCSTYYEKQWEKEDEEK